MCVCAHSTSERRQNVHYNSVRIICLSHYIHIQTKFEQSGKTKLGNQFNVIWLLFRRLLLFPGEMYKHLYVFWLSTSTNQWFDVRWWIYRYIYGCKHSNRLQYCKFSSFLPLSTIFGWKQNIYSNQVKFKIIMLCVSLCVCVSKQCSHWAHTSNSKTAIDWKSM